MIRWPNSGLNRDECAFRGVVEQPTGVVQRYAHTAMAAGHAEGFPGDLLSGAGVEADGLVRSHTHRERHLGNGVGASIHLGGSVLRRNLAVEDRCWRSGFAGADRNHANHLLIDVVDSQVLVGEVDHKAGDEFEHGEGTTELALAVSVEIHNSRSERISSI